MSEETTSLTLDQYQRRSAETDIDDAEGDPTIPLLGLAGEVGTLVSEFKKKHRPDGHTYTGFEDVVKAEMGDVLWYLAALARRADLDLSEVAEANLHKTRLRWLDDPERPRLAFDAEFDVGEQLPRQFVVEFSAHEKDGQVLSQMRISGNDIGDPIEDNAREPDYYRFHDIFHIGYAAVLGWSPILRSLVSRKRKTDPETDRAEDGARAAITEEAVAALVFNMASAYDFFAGAERVDDAILAAVQTITVKLEVGVCAARDWERAILAGFAVWRDLRDNEGGSVEVDLHQGTLVYGA